MDQDRDRDGAFLVDVSPQKSAPDFDLCDAPNEGMSRQACESRTLVHSPAPGRRLRPQTRDTNHLTSSVSEPFVVPSCASH